MVGGPDLGLRPRSGSASGSAGDGRARGSRPSSSRAAHRAPRIRGDALGAGQLRACDRGLRRPRRCPARGLPRAQGPRDQPGVPSPLRRGLVASAPPPRARRRRAGLRGSRAQRGRPTLRGAREGRLARLRVRRQERSGGGERVREARRDAPGHRARRGEHAGTLAAPAPPAARRPGPRRRRRHPVVWSGAH